MDVREKLVELFYKGVRCPGVIDNCNDCPHHSLEKPCDEFGATADMLIANGVTVQEWISVKDRLPEVKRPVIVYGGNGITIDWLEDYGELGLRWGNICCGSYKPEYWQPMPQPPKGE